MAEGGWDAAMAAEEGGAGPCMQVVPARSRCPASPTCPTNPIRQDIAFSGSEGNPDGVQVTITQSLPPGRTVITTEALISEDDDDSTVIELRQSGNAAVNTTFCVENPFSPSKRVSRSPPHSPLNTTVCMPRPSFVLADLPDPDGFPALPPIPKKKLPPRSHAPGCYGGCGGKCLNSPPRTAARRPEPARASPSRSRPGSAPGPVRVCPALSPGRPGRGQGAQRRPQSRPAAEAPRPVPAGVASRRFGDPSRRAVCEVPSTPTPAPPPPRAPPRAPTPSPPCAFEEGPRGRETLVKYVLKREGAKRMREAAQLDERPPWVGNDPSPSSSGVDEGTQEPQRRVCPALVPVEPYYAESIPQGLSPQELMEYAREQIGPLSPEMASIARGKKKAMMEHAVERFHVAPDVLFNESMEAIQLPPQYQQRMDEKLGWTEGRSGFDPRHYALPDADLKQFAGFPPTPRIEPTLEADLPAHRRFEAYLPRSPSLSPPPRPRPPAFQLSLSPSPPRADRPAAVGCAAGGCGTGMCDARLLPAPAEDAGWAKSPRWAEPLSSTLRTLPLHMRACSNDCCASCCPLRSPRGSIIHHP